MSPPDDVVIRDGTYVIDTAIARVTVHAPRQVTLTRIRRAVIRFAMESVHETSISSPPVPAAHPAA